MEVLGDAPLPRLKPAEMKSVLNDERDERDYKQSKLYELLKEFGGEGRAKIYRVGDGPRGGESYVASIAVDESVLDNLEEKIGQLYGGGRYELKFYHGRKCRGVHTVELDAEVWPRKKSGPEIAREGGQAPQSLSELMMLVQSAVKAALPQQVAHGGDQHEVLKTIVQMQNAHNAQLLELMKSQQAAQVAAAIGSSSGKQASPLAALKEAMELVELVRSGSGGGDGEGDPSSPGYKLMQSVVEKFGPSLAPLLARAVNAAPQQSLPSSTSSTVPSPASVPARVPRRAVPVANPIVEQRVRERPAAPINPAPAVKDAIPGAVVTPEKRG